MFNVKVVLDNKITRVYEGDKLIHQGSKAKDRAFGLNVIDQSHNPDCVHNQKWSKVTWADEGYRRVCYLVA